MESKLSIEEQVKRIKEVFEKFPDDERFIDDEDLERAKKELNARKSKS